MSLEKTEVMYRGRLYRLYVKKGVEMELRLRRWMDLCTLRNGYGEWTIRRAGMMWEQMLEERFRESYGTYKFVHTLLPMLSR